MTTTFPVKVPAANPEILTQTEVVNLVLPVVTDDVSQDAEPATLTGRGPFVVVSSTVKVWQAGLAPPTAPVNKSEAGEDVILKLVVTGAVTVTRAEADFVVSATLVAVTVHVPAVAGAVYNPEAETVPQVSVHVTDRFEEPVTVEVNC